MGPCTVDSNMQSMHGKPCHLLVTGPPGVGKTTVIMAVADQLAGRQFGGFYTQEIRHRTRRVGFEVQTFSGGCGILAHVDRPGPPRVGHYGVDVRSFEQCVLPELQGDCELLLIDEIGKMECYSKRFVERITTLLDGGCQVVATVALKGGGPITSIRRRPDVEIITVTPDNRDTLPAEIAMRLLKR